MARYEGTNPAPAVVDAGQSVITLLYARPASMGELDVLGVRLRRIAANYGPHVELQLVSADELPGPYAQTAHSTPTLVVLRDGAVIGEAIGALPARELDRLVRCAVEWPHQAHQP